MGGAKRKTKVMRTKVEGTIQGGTKRDVEIRAIGSPSSFYKEACSAARAFLQCLHSCTSRFHQLQELELIT